MSRRGYALPLTLTGVVAAFWGCSIDGRDLAKLALSAGGQASEGGAGGVPGTEIEAGGAGAALGDAGAPPSEAGSGGSASASGGSGAGGRSASGSGGAAAGGKAATSGGSGGASSGGVSSGGASSGGASNGGASNGGVSSGGNGSGGSSGGLGSGGALWACADLDANKTPDCNETLVKDATFESPFNPSQSNWKVDAGAVAAWDALDAGAGAPSGSLLLTNQSSTGTDLTQVGAAQCISVSAGKPYSAFAQSYAQASAGGVFARLSLTYFSNSGCTGAASSLVVAPLEGTTNGWRVLSLSRVAAPSGATSALVRLEVLKLPTSPSVNVRFDNVLVRAD
ncbi:MAG: hypothetical protein QM756_19980 [Polyangiaceae bacterium]